MGVHFGIIICKRSPAEAAVAMVAEKRQEVAAFHSCKYDSQLHSYTLFTTIWIRVKGTIKLLYALYTNVVQDLLVSEEEEVRCATVSSACLKLCHM